MIKKTTKTLDEIISALPDSAHVIDVGGASAPLRRANTILDLVPYNQIDWGTAKGPGEILSEEKDYIVHDICSREPFPIADNAYDFSFCSHVLEDIRDPIWVCSELIRISKCGYIEVPSRLFESTFNIESDNLAGAAHHRWLIDLVENKLRFTFKYFYIHKKAINLNRTSSDRNNEDMKLKLIWNDDFDFHENWLNSGKEMFEYYLDQKISERDKWRLYRKTSPHMFMARWLRYYKNTIPSFNKLNERIKEIMAKS